MYLFQLFASTNEKERSLENISFILCLIILGNGYRRVWNWPSMELVQCIKEGGFAFYPKSSEEIRLRKKGSLNLTGMLNVFFYFFVEFVCT